MEIVTIILFLVILFFVNRDEQEYHQRKKQAAENREKKQAAAMHRETLRSDYSTYKKDHRKFCVYRIAPQDSDVSVGYVGVTSNFSARKAEHLMHLKEMCHINKKLQEAWYNNEFTEQDFIILDENLSRYEAYSLEYRLRPRRNIGWNIKRGGDR
ncbi:GIY-YIG nuclease family protein [Vibrio parahaemolyticus]|uniref:GIY-YIG nuclease family protein n=1 Tax=Vibrio parahaemolyticus TaxID=670 RepID=UPI00387B06DA